jgi:tetratricopeptide (TPR) repeat protein
MMKPARWFRTLAALLMLATAVVGSARVEIRVDANNGDVISGERTFRVVVRSEHLVTQVEFYVGDDLRATDNSTPYEFRVDTLAEREGPFTVTFAAYTTEGEEARVRLDLTIDNQLGRGIDYFLERGREALTERKWDDALAAGRVALKIQADSNPARMVMARANFGKGVLDAAQTFVDQVIATEAGNVDALDLSAGINLQKAFAVFYRADSNREGTLDAIRTLFGRAAELRVRVNDTRLAALGAVTDTNRMAFVDLALRTRRYSLAISELERQFARDQRDSNVANRLIYAQIRAGRFTEARRTLVDHTRRGEPDAYGWALSAILSQLAGDTNASIYAERRAIVADGTDLGVRTMQAYLALLRGRGQAFAQVATDLARDEGERPEVLLYLNALYESLAQFDESRRAFERAVLADPALHDIYIQRANHAVAFSLQPGLAAGDAQHQRNLARVMLETALAARPESFEALTGLAIVALMDGRQEDAARMARAAVAAGPQYGGAHYTLAAVLANEAARAQRAQSQAEIARDAARLAGDAAEAARFDRTAREARERGVRLLDEMSGALESAGRFDQANLGGRSTPQPLDAWRYFARFGRIPLLTPPAPLPPP